MSQRKLAFLLVAVQAVLLGFLSETVVFPAVLCAAAALGTFSSLRIALSRDAAFRFSAGLAVVFLIKYRLAPHDFPYDALFVRTQLAHVMAQYILVMQAAQFFLRRDEDRLPASLPAWGTLVMVFAADVQVRGQARLICQVLSAAFVVLAAFYVASQRRPALSRSIVGGGRVRGAAQAIVLLLVVATAWLSASFLARNEREIESMLVQLLAGDRKTATVGFSTSARLGELAWMKSSADDRIALRVVAKQEPGYLRGLVFDEYRRSEWRNRSDSRLLLPIAELPGGLPPVRPGEPVFGMRDELAGGGWSTMECWRDASLGSHLFTPVNAVLVQATASEMMVDPYRIFKPSNLREDFPYTVLSRSTLRAAPLSAEDRARLIRVPPELDGRVAAIAEGVFADCRTTREKLSAVERYFHQNHEYLLEFAPPVPSDPLNWFLLERAPGHCELFASGAVMLLRLEGVPCRYVTGFVTAEHNEFGNYWVARNRDAHAWVEAYDEERGWVIVEATPAAGVPGAAGVETSASRELWESIRDRAGMWLTALQRDGLDRAIAHFGRLLRTVPGLAICTGLGLFAALRTWRRLRPAGPRARRQRPTELNRLLMRLDRVLGRRDFVRHSAETLHQFAARLEATEPDDELHRHAAAWYRRYADVRYRGGAEAAAAKELGVKLAWFEQRRFR